MRQTITLSFVRARASLRFAALAALATVAPAQTLKEFHFELKTLGGQTLTHAAFQDTVLLVDYWGTWCGPCKQAVPMLERLYRKYKHHGFEILGLCYERGDPKQAVADVRKFAAEQGVTYPLALGTPALQKAVPGFSVYPTLLFFKKGLVHAKTTTGFDPSHEKELETWLRAELGLDAEGAGGEPPDEEPGDPNSEPQEPEPKEELPKGVIHKPGEGDTGFDFEANDVDGKALKFADLRGKPVLLVLTSTWDQTAANTAKTLNDLHAAWAAKGVAVLAAHLEIAKQDAAKVAAILPFREQHGAKYRLFPAGLSFQRKIHGFVGMPLFLVFDAEGKLVLREQGLSDRVRDAVTTSLAGLTGQ